MKIEEDFRVLSGWEISSNFALFACFIKKDDFFLHKPRFNQVPFDVSSTTFSASAEKQFIFN
jgi:hypothetical protein